MTIYPHARIPYLGNFVDFAKYEAEAAKCPDPLPSHFPWLATNLAKLLGEERFDGKNHPV